MYLHPSPVEQGRSHGNVKVQGMGVFFLVMPYDMAPYWVDSKWFIEP